MREVPEIISQCFGFPEITATELTTELQGKLMIQSTQALILKALTETSAFWLDVDDFGVLILTKLPGSARAIRDGIKAELKKHGFDVHKEEEGTEIEITRILVGGSLGTKKARGLAGRMNNVHFIVAMTRHGIRNSFQGLQSPFGSMTWWMLFRRPILSVFDRVYDAQSAASLPALNAMIAKEHLRQAEATGIRLVQRDELAKPIFEDEEIIVQKKVRAPALAEMSLSREGFKLTWNWTEPSNIVEARTLPTAVQSLARNRRA